MHEKSSQESAPPGPGPGGLAIDDALAFFRGRRHPHARNQPPHYVIIVDDPKHVAKCTHLAVLGNDRHLWTNRPVRIKILTSDPTEIRAMVHAGHVVE